MSDISHDMPDFNVDLGSETWLGMTFSGKFAGLIRWFKTTRLKKELRDQFFVTLFVEQLYADKDDVVERRQAAAPVMNKLMERSDHWRSAYLAEQVSTGLYSVDKLKVEIRRRLVDARTFKIDSAEEFANLYTSLTVQKDGKAISSPSENKLFRLLLRIVNDVQWASLKRYLHREFAKNYMKKIYFLFFFAITLLLITFFKEAVPTQVCTAPANCGTDALPGLSGFWLAITSGLFGAAFSMISKAQDRIKVATLDDLQSMCSTPTLLIRISVGAGSALILYFIFQAGLLDGVMFPDLPKMGFVDVSADPGTATLGTWVPNASLSSLMVWSFLAGFSERLVPNFLDRIEKSGGEQKTDPVNSQ